jgi:hypothetical protein
MPDNGEELSNRRIGPEPVQRRVSFATGLKRLERRAIAC